MTTTEIILFALLAINIVFDAITYLKMHQNVQAKVDTEVQKVKNEFAVMWSNVRLDLQAIKAAVTPAKPAPMLAPGAAVTMVGNIPPVYVPPASPSPPA